MLGPAAECDAPIVSGGNPDSGTVAHQPAGSGHDCVCSDKEGGRSCERQPPVLTLCQPRTRQARLQQRSAGWRQRIAGKEAARQRG